MNTVEIANEMESKNKKCTTSLVLGILSIVTSIVAVGFILGIFGLIYGIAGIRAANSLKRTGKGRAVVGIITSFLGVVLSMVYSIMFGAAMFQ